MFLHTSKSRSGHSVYSLNWEPQPLACFSTRNKEVTSEVWGKIFINQYKSKTVGIQVFKFCFADIRKFNELKFKRSSARRWETDQVLLQAPL